jgi:hypothetical protein
MNKKIKYKGFVSTQDFDRLAACHVCGTSGAGNYRSFLAVKVLHLLHSAHPHCTAGVTGRRRGTAALSTLYAPINDASARLSYERPFSPRPTGPQRPWW